MARVVYVPELGRSFSFRDTASDQEISAYLEGNFNSPAPAEKAAAPDETKEPESDESGILGRFGVGLVRSLTDLPGGLSAVMYPAKQAEATPFGQFTKFAAETSEGIAGIDRTKQPTTAQETAEMVGGLAGLFIPGTAAAKAGTVAKLAPAVVRRIAGATAATQGALLNAEQRAEIIRQQLDAGMQISPEQQLRAQRLDAIVGLSEALPIERFWRPISTILSKVPASKIGMVEKILESRLGNIAKAATAEGLQEAGANVASDLVELNVYNPNVEVGQDILSNAAMGAFGGSLVETLVQVAAGRKMRGYRQLQADLRTEEGQNLADYRRGSVANAAERLRQFNVEGPVEISQEEIDNVPTFTIRTKGGNVLGSLPDIDSANQAIELYRKNTGADIQVVEPPKPIDVFPVKIGDKSFDSLDAVRTERDNLISRIQDAKVRATDPIRIKEGASKIGVSEPFYQKKAKADLDKLVREVEPLEKFVFDAQPTPKPEPVGDELGPDRIKALQGLSPIPFERPVYDGATKSKSRQSGQSPVVDYGGRKIVIKDVNGVKVPFYLSSGLAGKKNVAAGKWYPFFGIGGDGWINKGSQDQINNFYDSDELRAAAEELDGTIGDIRNDDSVPKVGLSGSHIDAINDGLSPSSNGEPDTGIRVSENIQSIINRIRSPQTTVEAVSAVEPSQPIGVSEAAPEAPEAGISAIPEADVGARPFEEPLASKTGPTPVPTEEEAGGKMAVGRLPGTFVRPKTVAEAEAVVTAPREYTPERKAYNDKLYNELSSRLQNIATPEIKLELRSMIDTAPGFLVRGHVTSKGTPNGVEMLVEISRDIIDPSKPIDDNVNALLDVLNHEIIHVVRRQLRPIEWQVLSKAVANTNVPGKKYTYLDKAEAIYMKDGVPMTPEYADPEAVIEEAVAEMYKDWVRNKRAPAQTRGPFNRITEFFRSIFRALKSNAQEGVFKSIESGEVGQREAPPQQDTAVPTDNVESIRFSAAPLPAYVEAKNETLFAKHDRVPFFKMVSDFLFNPNVGNRLINVQGYTEPVTLSKWTQAGLAARVAVTDKNAAVTYLEKLLNQKISGNFSRMVADFSATAALAWRNRSSHLTAAMIRMGKLDVDFARPGDIQSATLKVSEDPDSLMNVVKVLMEPGATDPNTGITKDKRDVYKSYAVAMRSKNKKAAGLSVPGEVDDNYINIVIPFTEQNYPEVVEAYKMYQRFNKKLLESAVKAGLIKQSELNNLTRDMDYYGFYHEVYDTAMVPGMATKTASEFKLRPYRGSEFGNLVNDPVFMMIHNAQFWVDSIAKNLATTKAFEVTRLMNESRLLGTGESPKEEEGEQKQVMFFKKDGVLKRFAVKDPLLVTALGSDDRIDMGRFFKMMGLPTHILRESVTRDPGFMIANLLRDTLSSWITSGEDIKPFLGTLNGAKKALKKETSFTALMGRGVVGSYDLAMLDPADLAAKISQIAKPRNVHTIPNLEAGINVVGSLWGRLGTLSEASDAATRIAVYDSAIKQGMSEAEASFRAIELMDFSRRGASSLLGVLTKLIPFLNARIQGLDVLYQAGRSGLRVLGGRTLGERDANLGKKFLVRGGMLAALSMFLEWANDGDDDYEQLEDYVKNGNLLIPLTMFGLEKQFLAIPKPFEAGLIFSTVPQQFYKSMSGEASTRENVQLFTAQLAGTFGVNPIPQALVPLAEVWWNVDMYTGLPLISEGKSRLAPELQYNSSTSTLSMMLGKIPISYNLTSGRFEGVSPIIIENLIEGYTGPVGSMIVDMVGIGMDAVDAGPERLPIDFTKLPVVRRVFVDAEKKNPRAVTQAYELFQLVDEVNRSLSRLKQMGDVEAIKDYVEQNRDILTYRKYIFKMVDGLNKLNARERQIERDASMTPDEKREAVRKLREFRINLTSKVSEINAALGR